MIKITKSEVVIRDLIVFVPRDEDVTIGTCMFDTPQHVSVMDNHFFTMVPKWWQLWQWFKLCRLLTKFSGTDGGRKISFHTDYSGGSAP